MQAAHSVYAGDFKSTSDPKQTGFSQIVDSGSEVAAAATELELLQALFHRHYARYRCSAGSDSTPALPSSCAADPPSLSISTAGDAGDRY